VSPEPVHIWVRQTVDWEDEAAFRAQLPERMRPKVELWDRTFTIPFHRFRARVRQITADTHARVEGARVSEWDEIPEGAWVLPTDDDDWLAPLAAQAVLSHARRGLTGVKWTSTHLQVPTNFWHGVHMARRTVLAPFTPPRSVCASNAYAMRKTSETQQLLSDHMGAGDWFNGEGSAQTQHIPGRFNVINKTLASQTQLAYPRPEMDRRELMLKYHAYRRLYRLPWVRGEWSRPHVEAMARLMDQLEVR
jgi:hypothetical protein